MRTGPLRPGIAESGQLACGRLSCTPGQVCGATSLSGKGLAALLCPAGGEGSAGWLVARMAPPWALVRGGQG